MKNLFLFKLLQQLTTSVRGCLCSAHTKTISQLGFSSADTRFGADNKVHSPQSPTVYSSARYSAYNTN